MKQNTKFLWMYIGILFSFALILIIFAGFSVNTETEQTQGKKDNIISLSQKNTDLTNKVASLEKEKENLNQQIGALYSEVTNLKADNDQEAATEVLITEALELYESKKTQECEEKLASIDVTKLTQSQKYLYDMMTK